MTFCNVSRKQVRQYRSQALHVYLCASRRSDTTLNNIVAFLYHPVHYKCRGFIFCYHCSVYLSAVCHSWSEFFTCFWARYAGFSHQKEILTLARFCQDHPQRSSWIPVNIKNSQLFKTVISLSVVNDTKDVLLWYICCYCFWRAICLR